MSTAISNYSTAKGYIQAAALQMMNPLRLTSLADDTTLVMSFHMLAGFSAELYLKSYLSFVGRTDAELKSAALRHDLNALCQACEDEGLVAPGARLLASLLHDKHKTFEFRYMTSGSAYSLMPLNLVFDAFSDLDVSVDTAIGASAAHGLTPGGRWMIPKEMWAWRVPK